MIGGLESIGSSFIEVVPCYILQRIVVIDLNEKGQADLYLMCETRKDYTCLM